MNAQDWCMGFYNRLWAIQENRHGRPIRQATAENSTGRDLESGAGTGLDFAHYRGPIHLAERRPDPYLLELARWRC